VNEEFEKWAGANGLCLERDFEAPENYVDGMTQEAELAWNAAWQASRKQALEDAAKECDRIMQENDADSPYHAGGAELCADAIRALNKD